MRVAFVAKRPETLPAVEAVFLAHDFVVADHPSVVVVMGGDGTLLKAERLYPGIPKALLKDSAIGNLYAEASAEEVAQALKSQQYAVEERVCLEATVHGHVHRGANDIIIRNKRLTQAIRFSVFVDDVPFETELIGDGLVLATPLGSTAYYFTLTREKFAKGIGLAFNNIHNRANLPARVLDSCQVRIVIHRGPAQLGVDNSEHAEDLVDGDEIRVTKSLTPLRIIRLGKPQVPELR